MDKGTREDMEIFREAIRQINRRRTKRGQSLARYVLELDECSTCSNTMKDELEAIRNHRWIKCSEAMPDEHDSVFKKCKGTEKWRPSMWTKQSKTVDITIEYPDGSRRTGIGKTLDEKWNTDMGLVEVGEVIAWRPRPEPYSGN